MRHISTRPEPQAPFESKFIPGDFVTWINGTQLLTVNEVTRDWVYCTVQKSDGSYQQYRFHENELVLKNK